MLQIVTKKITFLKDEIKSQKSQNSNFIHLSPTPHPNSHHHQQHHINNKHQHKESFSHKQFVAKLIKKIRFLNLFLPSSSSSFSSKYSLFRQSSCFFLSFIVFLFRLQVHTLIPKSVSLFLQSQSPHIRLAILTRIVLTRFAVSGLESSRFAPINLQKSQFFIFNLRFSDDPRIKVLIFSRFSILDRSSFFLQFWFKIDR